VKIAGKNPVQWVWKSWKSVLQVQRKIMLPASARSMQIIANYRRKLHLALMSSGGV